MCPAILSCVYYVHCQLNVGCETLSWAVCLKTILRNHDNYTCTLQADEGLRQLRFRLVPKYCSEEQFWNRYFAAVERVKQQVKTEQMWGDFDMLDSDGIEPSGEPLHTTLPFCWSAANDSAICNHVTPL